MRSVRRGNEFGKDNIELLQRNYITFGINCFPIVYPNITYWVWSDFGVYPNIKHLIKGSKVITSNEVYKREILGDFEPEFIFEGQDKISHNLEDNKLLIYKTTAHATINYAYLKGFKNVLKKTIFFLFYLLSY